MSTVAHRPAAWITGWFALSTMIVFWDAGFCLLRPRSQSGGDLHYLWAPYALYETVDLVYGKDAFLRFDGFTSAQAILNLFENALNITYLLLARQKSPVAVLIGFSAVLFTFWKTTLYWLMDYMSGPNGWGQTGHNSQLRWWILFALPNGFWIIVPLVIATIFGREIAKGLNLRAAVASVKQKQ